jgi:hypothetical protein
MSEGVGSTFKEIILTLCKIVTWIYNNIWANIMCPVIQFLLEFLQMCTDVWEILVNVLRTLYIPVDILVTVIDFVRNTMNVIASSLNECAPLPSDVCVLAPPVSANTNAWHAANAHTMLVLVCDIFWRLLAVESGKIDPETDGKQWLCPVSSAGSCHQCMCCPPLKLLRSRSCATLTY